MKTKQGCTVLSLFTYLPMLLILSTFSVQWCLLLLYLSGFLSYNFSWLFGGFICCYFLIALNSLWKSSLMFLHFSLRFLLLCCQPWRNKQNALEIIYVHCKCQRFKSSFCSVHSSYPLIQFLSLQCSLKYWTVKALWDRNHALLFKLWGI